ncbi:hypothetical protein ACCS71_14235 [Rhizobium ruizarguesonis]
MIIDFDRNDWMRPLEVALGHLVNPSIKDMLRRSTFEYTDDALKAFAAATDIEAVIDRTVEWIGENRVRAYHGTRLTDVEAAALSTTGLRPLNISERMQWIRNEFPVIDQALTPERTQKAMHEGLLEGRENQVHAAISHNEMLRGYDYLFKGAEFDRRLLEYAGLEEMVDLLTSRGKPRLVKLLFPGAEALHHMHFFTMEQCRRDNGYPNLVREMLEEFVWQVHEPSSSRQSVDACLHIRTAVPGAYVEKVEEFDESAV